MSVTTSYEFQATAGNAEALLSLLRQGRALALNVEGCEGFDLFQGLDDPHLFVMTEHWTSVDAHEAHAENNLRASGILQAAEALMIEPLKVDDAFYQRI